MLDVCASDRGACLRAMTEGFVRSDSPTFRCREGTLYVRVLGESLFLGLPASHHTDHQTSMQTVERM